jgi:polysaccharide pyruvyl transferase WcaK-like protein
MTIDRRTFLYSAMGVTGAAALARAALAATKPDPHILLRSAWQTVNIGDIGHTPGALRLFEKHLPEARVTLWPSVVDRGVAEMLRARFSKLRILEGAPDAVTGKRPIQVDRQGKPNRKDLREAFEECDLMVHGSSSGVVEEHLVDWRKCTGKPYGLFGVSVWAVDAELSELLSNAAFVFCRDTTSLKLMREKGVSSSVMEFGPDATFAIDLRDEGRATNYLKKHNLREREFICAIPRLRYTPYFKILGRQPTTQETLRHETSEQFNEPDHAKLREVIIQWVRKTGLKVLACPEMIYQVELAKTQLVDPLPDDVKRNVVWRDSFWGVDEAASVYARAHTIVSFEMHSPIIAASVGTPAFYLRQPTDTSKGQMWRDIGLEDWIFEVDDTQGDDVARRLMEVHAGYDAARTKLAKAMAFVADRQNAMSHQVGRVSSSGT